MLAQLHVQVREEDPSLHGYLPLFFVHLQTTRVAIIKINVANLEDISNSGPPSVRRFACWVSKEVAKPKTLWMILVIKVN